MVADVFIATVQEGTLFARLLVLLSTDVSLMIWHREWLVRLAGGCARSKCTVFGEVKQTEAVPAAVCFGLTSEGQVPNSRVNLGPLAVGVGRCLLPEASVVSHPRTALILIAGLQHENLVAHQIRHTLRLLSGDDRHIYSKGLEPFCNTGDWALLRLGSHCFLKTQMARYQIFKLYECPSLYFLYQA